MAPSLSTDGAKENWLRGQDLNLRPSGYKHDFTQPADGRRPSCFQSSRVVSSSAKSTEVHAGIRKSPPVWTRSGQGFGLPVAKRIIEAHGGQIWVESPPKNQPDSKAHFSGTKLSFWIPLRAYAPTEPHPTPFHESAPEGGTS